MAELNTDDGLEDRGLEIDLDELDRMAEGKSTGDRLNTKTDDGLEADGGDEDRDRKRESRRAERNDRKTKRNAFDEEREARIEALETRVQQYESNFARSRDANLTGTINKIDSDMAESRAAYEDAKKLLAEASAKSNGEAVVTATETMQAARSNYERLAARKEGIVIAARQDQERRKQAEDSGADFAPSVKRYARQFIESHDWYDPQGRDDDSQVVKRLDAELAKEGSVAPGTKAYWTELEERVKDELPHRFKGGGNKNNGDRNARDDRFNDTRDDDRNSRRGSPTGGSGREGGGDSGGNGRTGTVPAAFVRNMKEAGQWEDPKTRARVIKRYFETQENIRREGRR